MEQTIKMVDLQGQNRKIREELDRAVGAVIDSTAFIQGEAVQRFTRELASYLETPYVVPCANGTDALQLAYQALGLVAGDEVLMPTFNYVASVEAAALLGIKPVLVDVHRDTFNLDETQLESKITPATRAIVVVHLFGQSANMEPILQLADRYNLKVIEDNAQSLGSAYTFSDGTRKKTGTMGDIGTYSFFPTKNLGCFGDGGALSTSDPELARRSAMIAKHGQGEKYRYEIIGCNSRLDTLQAAILSVKLQHLEGYLSNRIVAAGHYDRLFTHTPGIITPSRFGSARHTFNQYVIRVEQREKVRTLLAHSGIPTMIYYPAPLHLQKAYDYLGYKAGDFPVAEQLCREVLAIPMHTELTLEQQQFIAENLIHSI